MDQGVITWLLQQTPVVVVLGIVIYALWGEYKKEKEYSKAQEKLVVDVLNQMSNLLSKISENEKDNSDVIENVRILLGETKTLVDIRTSEVITLLKNKGNVKDN
jgi:hypothetical protein